mmetsp:Transcript_21937/g.59945  ORF Transcript_21937/g.59945 Transcript_21937/m.59945 type:complete len:311 (-) Transcript_21937:18-950(-)
MDAVVVIASYAACPLEGKQTTSWTQQAANSWRSPTASLIGAYEGKGLGALNTEPSGLHKLLRGGEPAGVLALLLVERHGVDKVADLAAHAKLCQVLIKGLLHLIVQVLELRPVVGGGAVLLGLGGVGLDHPDDVAVVLAVLGAAEEGHASTALVLHRDADLRCVPLRHLPILALLLAVRVEGAAELPLYAHGLVPELALQGHVHVAVRLDELEGRGLQEALDHLGLLVLLLLVLQLPGQDLRRFAARSSADAPLRQGRDWEGSPGAKAPRCGPPRCHAQGRAKRGAQGRHGDLRDVPSHSCACELRAKTA